jgi:thymidine phosphorylase
VRAVHARPIGQAAVALGAGRRTLEDRIHPGVGFEIHARPGARTAAGDVLAVVHAADRESADAAAVAVLDAIEIGDERAPEPLPLLSHRIDAAGVETLA